MAGYDADPPAALADALAVVLGRSGAGFDELVDLAGFAPARAAALHARDDVALDALAAELNEQRGLDR